MYGNTSQKSCEPNSGTFSLQASCGAQNLSNLEKKKSAIPTSKREAVSATVSAEVTNPPAAAAAIGRPVDFPSRPDPAWPGPLRDAGQSSDLRRAWVGFSHQTTKFEGGGGMYLFMMTWCKRPVTNYSIFQKAAKKT